MNEIIFDEIDLINRRNANKYNIELSETDVSWYKEAIIGAYDKESRNLSLVKDVITRLSTRHIDVMRDVRLTDDCHFEIVLVTDDTDVFREPYKSRLVPRLVLNDDVKESILKKYVKDVDDHESMSDKVDEWFSQYVVSLFDFYKHVNLLGFDMKDKFDCFKKHKSSPLKITNDLEFLYKFFRGDLKKETYKTCLDSVRNVVTDLVKGLQK